MEELKLITCIVQRGKADDVVKAALAAGAQGATMFYGRGTGVRQRLGALAQFIVPEKEVVLIVTEEPQAAEIFETAVEVGRLREKGQGFAYIQKVEHAVGLLEELP
ncbi:MAG: P-II family nitrogen regulator [Desulfurivibrio sp.]|nr:P-II family nitrogen regulator [Desulfurivibrio sp.]